MLNWGLLVMIIVIPLFLSAQPNLVISKPGKTRHFYYQPGDKIEFRDQAGKRHSGVILILNDSAFALARSPLQPISTIRIIYRHRYFFTKTAELGVAGVLLYFPISVINRALQKEKPLVGKEQFITHGAVLSATGISLLFLHKKFKIGEPWKLQVLDFGRPIYQ